MFNAADPFDAAALYHMWFNCVDCDAIFDFEPKTTIDLEYYHLLGQAARRHGWFVAPGRETDGEDPDYMVCCPKCAIQRGLNGHASHEHEVQPSIDALCDTMVAVA